MRNAAPLERFDPRLKVVVALLLIVGIVSTPDRAYPAYFLIWALIAALAAAGRLNVLTLARRSMIALPFALAGLTLLFTPTGAVVMTIMGLPITDAGIVRFGGVLLKTILAAHISVLLAFVTPFNELLWALQALRVPAPLTQITALLYRYLFTVSDEARRLLTARSARSARLAGRRSGGTVTWRARTAGMMIGSLFLRSLERSERVYAAMASRGFTGAARLPDPPPPRWRSIGVGLLPVALVAAIQVGARLWWT